MGMTEKDSLINAITVSLCDDCTIGVKELKARLTEIMQDYHISISDERFTGKDLSTEYLMKKFVEGKLAIGMSENTIKQYKIAISKLETFTNKRLSDMESDDITMFLKDYGKTVSDVTLKGKYQLLSSVYNYLFNHKYIPFNPMLYIDTPKATVIYKTPLSNYELEKIKYACEKMNNKESVRNMAMIYFFVSTGCRVSELCNLKIGDVDLVKKTCVVMGKGRKQRPVYLSEKTVYRLKLYLETRKDRNENAPLFAHIRGKECSMTKEGVERMLHKIREMTGITNLTCHTFRRFYATELRRRNVNIQVIANSLGHANLNQINRYALYGNDEMQNIIHNAI